jgi:hypothetical protein
MCDCIALTNTALEPMNARLDVNFNLSGGPTTVSIGTSLIEKRRGARPPVLIPAFCPFCSKRYEDVETTDDPGGARE